jgi:diguanylate cyclase (GGDEF)-like protein
MQAVSAPITLSTGDKVSVGISVGIASYTETIDSVATLLAQADKALYKAKSKK